MVDAEISGDTAILNLKVKIPKHYYEFFEQIEDVLNFDTARLERMAAGGIIIDLNTIQDELTDAMADIIVDVKPQLQVGKHIFKAAVQKPEERQP